MNRAITRLTVLAIASALAIAGCGSSDDESGTKAADTSASQENHALKVLYTPAFTGHLPALIAADSGLFDEHGLDVTLTASDEPLTPLLSGDVDIALPAPAVAAVGAGQSGGVKILMGIQGKITQSLLVRPEVADALSAQSGDYPAIVEELDGKKLGVSTRGGSVDINLRYILKEAGLTPDEDVQVVAAGGGSEMLAGLKSGQLDGILGFPPLSNVAIEAGDGVAVLELAKGQGPPALQQPFVIAATQDSLLEDQPEAAHAFVDAMVDTMEWIRDPANEAELKSIVEKRLEGVDASLVPSIIEELKATLSPAFTQEDLEKVLAVQRSVGDLPKDVTAQGLIATEFVPASG